MIEDDLLYEYRGKTVVVIQRGANDTLESAWLMQEGTLLYANAVGVKLTRTSDGKVVVYPWSAIERVVAS